MLQYIDAEAVEWIWTNEMKCLKNRNKKRMQSENERNETKKNWRKNVASQKMIQCIIHSAKIKDNEENYGNFRVS